MNSSFMRTWISTCVLAISLGPLTSLLHAAEAPRADSVPRQPRFRTVEIDTKVEIGYGVAVADVDGDGRTDILLAEKNLIVWYRNPAWEKHVMAEKLTPPDHVCLAACDIDGDGKAEVAAGAGWNPNDTVSSGSVHYLLPPADRAARWEALPLPHEPTVHRMRWVRDEAGKYQLVVLPLHGRGNKGGQGEGVRMLAYHMVENPRAPWTTELIDDTLHMTHNFDVVQWDDDAEHELIVAAREGVFLFDLNLGKWHRTPLAGSIAGNATAGFAGAGEIRHGRLPGGKRFVTTIEPMHGNMVASYTAPASPESKELWQRVVVDATLREVHALGTGDFLGIGSDQVVAGWRGKNSDGKVGIRFYTPLDATGQQWRQTILDDNMACEDLTISDLNKDGRLDIIASGRATKNLKIYFGEP